MVLEEVIESQSGVRRELKGEGRGRGWEGGEGGELGANCSEEARRGLDELLERADGGFGVLIRLVDCAWRSGAPPLALPALAFDDLPLLPIVFTASITLALLHQRL